MTLHGVLSRAARNGQCDVVRYRGREIVGTPSEVREGLAARDGSLIAPQGLLSIGAVPSMDSALATEVIRSMSNAFLQAWRFSLQSISPEGPWPDCIYPALAKSAGESLLGSNLSGFDAAVNYLAGGLLRGRGTWKPLRGSDRRELLESFLRLQITSDSSEPASIITRGSARVDEGARSQWVASIVVNLLTAMISPLASAASWLALEIATGEAPLTIGQESSFIREVLRLHPPAWVISRIVETETAGNQYKYFSPYLAHRHPNYFDKSNKFDPSRWGESARHNPAYLPFGAGVYGCPGGGLAMGVLRETVPWLTTSVLRPRHYRYRPRREVGPVLYPAPFHLARVGSGR